MGDKSLDSSIAGTAGQLGSPHSDVRTVLMLTCGHVEQGVLGKKMWMYSIRPLSLIRKCKAVNIISYMV